MYSNKLRLAATLILFFILTYSFADEYSIQDEKFGLITIELPPDVQIEESGKNNVSAKYSFKYSNSILQVTFIWGSDIKNKFNNDSMMNFVEETGKKLLSSAVEKDISILELKIEQGNAYYFSVTDKNPLPNGYKYLSQGLLRFGEIGGTFTILHNDESMAINKFWLNIITSLRHNRKKLYSNNFEKLKLVEDDIKNIARFDDNLHLLSIQVSLFYQNNDIYEGIIPKCKAKEYQSFSNEEDKGSVLFLLFERDIDNSMGFLKGLIYGDSGKPSRDHPEILVPNKNILIIYSFPYESKLGNRIQNIIDTKL